MKDRCLNPQCKSYKNYGARGIGIYEPWINSFEAFFAYVGPKPSPKHSLERVNNDDAYRPGNVVWATSKRQAQNKRGVHRIPIPGGGYTSLQDMSRMLKWPRRKLDHLTYIARTSIKNGTTTAAEQGTKVGIEIVYQMLLADMLKGADDHQAPMRAVLRLI
jgi:hypothetical protein